MNTGEFSEADFIEVPRGTLPSECTAHKKGGTCRARVYRFERRSTAKKWAKKPEAAPMVQAIVDCEVPRGLEPADNREGRGVSHFKTCVDVRLFS